MIIIPSISSGISSGGLFDKDALTYFSTATITNTTARNQINNFIKEIKRLGLWNNIVCWPLINTQQGKSAGSASGTIYSLGGLGSYNATVVNSLTIDSDGVTANGSVGYGYLVVANGANLLAVNPVSSGAVYKTSGTTWGGGLAYWVFGNQYGATTNLSSGGWFREAVSVGLINQMRGETLLNSLGTANDQTSFCFFTNTTSSSASNNSLNYKNGVLSTTQTVGTTISPEPSGSDSYQFAAIPSYSALGAFSGTTAFHFVIRNVLLSATDVLSIYNIYKQTLGSFIVLP